ncbi:MAG TPA: BON domain-containing protein [Acidimicrobiales bacterium]|nr:BON domain-containing protein [Acidimicrobiales bacterium]
MTAERDAAAEYRRLHLSEALVADEGVGELGLAVEVDGDDVYVTGTVSTAERRRRVGEVVAEQAPGGRVHNRTEVAGAAPPEGEERL